MLNEWMVAFWECGFDGIAYSYAFVYSSESVPNQSMSGVPKIAAQYAVLGKRVKCHPEKFKQLFKSQFSGMSSTSKLACSVITNVIYQTNNEKLWKAPPTVRKKHLLSDVSHGRIFAHKGLICDPFSEMTTLALAAGAIER